MTTIFNEDLNELTHLLPRAMPEGQTFRVGDWVIVRLKKQPQILQRGRITSIRSTTGSDEAPSVLAYDRSSGEDWVINLNLEGQGKSEYPCWLRHDILYKLDWVNSYLGRDRRAEPKIKPAGSQEAAADPQILEQSDRFRHLMSREPEDT